MLLFQSKYCAVQSVMFPNARAFTGVCVEVSVDLRGGQLTTMSGSLISSVDCRGAEDTKRILHMDEHGGTYTVQYNALN